MRDFESLEKTLRRASVNMLVTVIIRCIKEIFALKDKNAELEERIEKLEGKA
jgi:ubiquinone biosynthesis protein UbiJ